MSIQIKDPPVPPTLTTLASEVVEMASEIHQLLLSGPSISADLVSDLFDHLGDARAALEDASDDISCASPDVMECVERSARAHERKRMLRRDFARLADEVRHEEEECEVVEWSGDDEE